MAEAVFCHLVEQAGLSDKIAVESAGTGDWHVGQPRHPGTRDVLRRQGIACVGMAQQVTPADLRAADYVIAMDATNVTALANLVGRDVLDGKVRRLTEFAPPGAPRDVPDPYYTGNFDEVYRLVEAGCRGLLAQIRAERGL